jgi:hypothetical protein
MTGSRMAEHFPTKTAPEGYKFGSTVLKLVGIIIKVGFSESYDDGCFLFFPVFVGFLMPILTRF